MAQMAELKAALPPELHPERPYLMGDEEFSQHVYKMTNRGGAPNDWGAFRSHHAAQKELPVINVTFPPETQPLLSALISKKELSLAVYKIANMIATPDVWGALQGHSTALEEVSKKIKEFRSKMLSTPSESVNSPSKPRL